MHYTNLLRTTISIKIHIYFILRLILLLEIIAHTSFVSEKFLVKIESNIVFSIKEQ